MSIPTFCTANLPADVINKLLEDTQLAEMAYPVLSIIRTPDQKEFDEGTLWPIEEFTTGFLGMSEDDIIRFHRQLEQTGVYKGTDMVTEWVAILDEESARQSTVVLYHCQEREHWIDEGKDQRIGYFTEYEDGYFFWKWRMPASHIYSAFAFIDHTLEEALSYYCRPELIGPDGVFDVATYDKVIRGEIQLPTWRRGMALL
ncbi:hypothetical protein FQN49_000277 [Arthroderma sp. PD_2]|nr:hypothetical protein FQN49_000277 [Arthroderma sp. PD_2]